MKKILITKVFCILMFLYGFSLLSNFELRWIGALLIAVTWILVIVVHEDEVKRESKKDAKAKKRLYKNMSTKNRTVYIVTILVGTAIFALLILHHFFIEANLNRVQPILLFIFMILKAYEHQQTNGRDRDFWFLVIAGVFSLATVLNTIYTYWYISQLAT